MAVLVFSVAFIIGLVAYDTTFTTAWPSTWFNEDIVGNQEKRNQVGCVGASGNCYNTAQCCNGLVCASLDDYFGQQPKVPGYCVKGKELISCVSNLDCGPEGQCVHLGRSGQRYCLSSADEPLPTQNRNGLFRRHPSYVSKITGGLGASCEDDSDCQDIDESGRDKFCCQQVRKGRQGIRKQCDRVTEISVCITRRK